MTGDTLGTRWARFCAAAAGARTVPGSQPSRARNEPDTPVLCKALYAELDELYSERRRHYHGWDHISRCLSVLDHRFGGAGDLLAVEGALFYHDAVYDPYGHGATNEARSAELARKRLTELAPDGRLAARVADLVFFTAYGWKLDRGVGRRGAREDRDRRRVRDIDLSILGAPWIEFLRYEALIRAEYADLSTFLYKKRRSSVLRHFLALPRIYGTDELFARYERTARENLRLLVRRL